MKEFIEFLFKNLVKNPQSVTVEEEKEGNNRKYTVSVDPSDMGLVIGKEGKTINSIRSLAKAKAVKDGLWVEIQLAETLTSNSLSQENA